MTAAAGLRAPARPAAAARLLDAGATSLEGFLAANVAKPAAVATDGWAGYADLPAKGYHHEPINLSTPGAMSVEIAAITSSTALQLARRQHHGRRRRSRGLPRAHVSRFNRRIVQKISPASRS